MNWWKIFKAKRKMEKVMIIINNGWATIFPWKKDDKEIEIDEENEEFNSLRFYPLGAYKGYYNKEEKKYVWLEKI